jgi:nicotinamide riboside kinase
MMQDGIRSNNEEFRKEVDIRYRAKLKKLGIKFIVISGSRRERVRQAIEHMSK